MPQITRAAQSSLLSIAWNPYDLHTLFKNKNNGIGHYASERFRGDS